MKKERKLATLKKYIGIMFMFKLALHVLIIEIKAENNEIISVTQTQSQMIFDTIIAPFTVRINLSYILEYNS